VIRILDIDFFNLAGKRAGTSLSTNNMNDQEFLTRLWANPADQSPDFLEARSATAERTSLWETAQDFEGRLHRVMNACPAPAHLEAALLAIPTKLDATQHKPADAARISANDSIWRRALPVAACLALTLGLAVMFQPDRYSQLQNEILQHVYAEESFLSSNMHFTLAEVNTQLKSKIGAKIQSSPAVAGLDVRFMKDCWVDKETAMHLVISGETGPVSMMLVPTEVVDTEVPINDERFTGFVTPVRGGTLVLLGNRQEPLQKYVHMIDDSIDWQY
jgi:hypothetical protein